MLSRSRAPSGSLSDEVVSEIVGRVLAALSMSSMDWLLPQDMSSTLRLLGGDFWVMSGTPTTYLTETDQTDPAGRYRLRVSGDVFTLDRALTAGWASVRNILTWDEGNNTLTLQNPKSTASIAELLAGSTLASEAYLKMTAAAAGGTLLVQIGDGTASYKNAVSLTKTRAAFGVPISGGIDSSVDNLDLTLQGNAAATDATATDVYIRTLNPAADSYVIVGHAVPTGTPSTPFWEENWQGTTPLNTTLSSGFGMFKYATGGGAVTLYVNDGGTIRSLSLGTPA